MTVHADPSIDIFSELYAALTARDLDRSVAVFTPDIHYFDMGLGRELHGRREVRELYRPWYEVADVSAALEDGFATETRALARWVFSGEIRAELPGIWTSDAIGGSFHLSGATVARIAPDGLISEAYDYWNMAELLSQVS